MAFYGHMQHTEALGRPIVNEETERASVNSGIPELPSVLTGEAPECCGCAFPGQDAIRGASSLELLWPGTASPQAAGTSVPWACLQEG